MNLWFSSLCLVVGFFMSSSAHASEECRHLVKPKTTFVPMYGRWTFLLGYSDNAVFDAMFTSAQSMWIDFIHSPTDKPNEMIEDIGIRHPSYCKYASTVVTVAGNIAFSQKSNYSCTYYSLPTCSSCLLYYVTSINNNNLLEIDNPTTKEQLTSYKALYLMSTKIKVNPADLAQFKKQAECLGFKGEPAFRYEPKNPFCHKED